MAQPINLGPKTTFIPITTKGLQPLPEREAWPIYFDGFEGIDFILFKMDGCWAINELSTKLSITGGHGSKYEANDKAIYLLGIVGPEKTKLAIERALNCYGDTTK